MREENIPYQSFCWVIGTTSFRTAKLNLKIEEQLLLLDEFYKSREGHGSWEWDNNSQQLYYAFMKEKGFLSGEAKRKDKDAREKTSGLVDIGLISEDRTITAAGRELLNLSKKGEFSSDNIFNIDSDSFVYLKQLLKTTINVNDNVVRPYLVVLKCLNEFKYLTYDEFTYLVPLIVDKESCKEVVSNIRKYRALEVSLDDVIFDRLMKMENYRRAFRVFYDSKITESLICLIGMNRKSRNYDRPYFELYRRIKEVFIEHKGSYEELFEAAKAVKQKPGALWRNLIFNTSNVGVIKKRKAAAIADNCPFAKCTNEKELKKLFFKYLHVFKARATLSDYFDLNRRYFNITDTIIFEDGKLKLDLLPEYYFAEIMKDLDKDIFKWSDKLKESVPLAEISTAFSIDIEKIYEKISKETGAQISNPEQAASYVNDERHRRFNELVDKKFSDSVLIELLECFERRDDKRIEELVTDDAAIPTIFEYVLGIIWYKVSERQGNILDFMKLSLEANLLPKTHAQGGAADIVYEYEACSEYPKHALLIEATLADGTNQRRMEMEPVSRHLGEYRIKFNNKFDYSLFVSTYLDENVVTDFRYRKEMPYKKNGKIVEGMKIIPLDTKSLKRIMENNMRYKKLYAIFDANYEKPLKMENWHTELLKEVAGDYICKQN